MVVDLRDELKKEKPIYGLSDTLKKLKHGGLKKIFVASNCPDKEGLLKQAKHFGVEVVEMKENNVELGIVCKKPYAISVLSFKQE